MTWHECHPLPWSVAQRDGEFKFKGTKIIDANGDEVCGFSIHSHDKDGPIPSRRELEKWNGNLDLFRAECCDSHWEGVPALDLAEFIVAAANKTGVGK